MGLIWALSGSFEGEATHWKRKANTQPVDDFAHQVSLRPRGIIGCKPMSRLMRQISDFVHFKLALPTFFKKERIFCIWVSLMPLRWPRVIVCGVDSTADCGYVYNTETDLVRVVALMPTYKWGGGGGRRGLLGAEVGVGYLHRLPFKTRDTSGSSVERKVRYVNVENSTENRDNENNNSHKVQTPGSSTSSRRQLQPQLELEPQLEMEPGSDDDDDDEGGIGSAHSCIHSGEANP